MPEYIPPTKYIVYELRKPDGTPFYVGKGLRARPLVHLVRARNGSDRNPYTGNVIRKIERDGETVEIAVMLETDDESMAFSEEIRLIAAYRCAGFKLTNLTNGGEGTSGGPGNRGYRHTPESRAKISEANKGNFSNKGRSFSPEHRANMSAAQYGRVVSDETRAKISAALTGKPLNPERVARSAAAHRGRPFSAEHRAKIAEAKRRWWAQQRDAASKEQS